MNKVLKGLMAACLAVCAIVCVCFAAACQPQEELPKHETYTVKVLLEDGSPALNVRVQMCANNGRPGCAQPIEVDDKGVAEVNLKSYFDNGSTSFNVHLLDIPEGYLYVDEDGNPYSEDPIDNDGKEVKIADGYSTTITLVKAPETQKKTFLRVNVRLSVTNPTHSMTFDDDPESDYYIPGNGLYEFKAADSRFTLKSQRYGTVSCGNSSLVYLEVGDTVEIGTADLMKFTLFIILEEIPTGEQDSPFNASNYDAAFIKAEANSTYHFFNPEKINNGMSNTSVQINGKNFTATVDGHNTTSKFVAVVGKGFTVKATDSANYVQLSFTRPNSSHAVEVGEASTFEIPLVNTAIDGNAQLEWVTGENFNITFRTTQAGYYKVALSSALVSDGIYFVDLVANNSVVEAVEETKREDGVVVNEYYAVYYLNAGATVTLEFASNGDYSSLDASGSISYTVLAELLKNYTPPANDEN